MHRYGAAYSTWPTPTRSGDHIRSWCGGHYQHSGRDAAKVGVSQRTRGLALLNPESWCGDHNQWSITGLPRTMPPHKDTSIPDMPVCHCVGLHQEWAASADATTVTPTLVGREEARGSPLRRASASRRSSAGTLAEQEPQFTLRQHRTQRGRVWKLHIWRAVQGGHRESRSAGSLPGLGDQRADRAVGSRCHAEDH